MFDITFNNSTTQWSEQTLKSKLETIGNLSGKKVAWIKSDLSISRSNLITRLFWTLIAKHFSWMRSFFYGVNLEQSSSILSQIGQQIQQKHLSPDIKGVYLKAIDQFEQIAPNHSSNLKTYASNMGLEGATLKETINYIVDYGKYLNEIVVTNEITSVLGAEQIISYCPNLRKLCLSDCDLEDHQLDQLHTLTALEELDLSYNALITDESLRGFEQLTNLKSLIVYDCELVTRERIDQLRQSLPKLTRVIA